MSRTRVAYVAEGVCVSNGGSMAPPVARSTMSLASWLGSRGRAGRFAMREVSHGTLFVGAAQRLNTSVKLRHYPGARPFDTRHVVRQ